jgi:uncharacterized protein (TIGR02186 family)
VSRLASLLAVLTIGVAAHAGQASAQQDSHEPLLIDLSEELIGITTGFTGTDVLLFGATEGTGDVIVEVRAPDSAVTVRAKERIAGIWMNTESVAFTRVPGYYHIAASRPIEEILPAETLAQEMIGVDNLAFGILDSGDGNDAATFRDALVRNKQRARLFYRETGEVTFQRNRLFRTLVAFPSNVPTGQYNVTVHLVSDGAIVSRSETRLFVRKIGLEAQLTEFAYQQAPFYGLIAVAIALVAGWLAGFMFRKV